MSQSERPLGARRCTGRSIYRPRPEFAVKSAICTRVALREVVELSIEMTAAACSYVDRLRPRGRRLLVPFLRPGPKLLRPGPKRPRHLSLLSAVRPRRLS